MDATRRLTFILIFATAIALGSEAIAHYEGRAVHLLSSLVQHVGE